MAIPKPFSRPSIDLSKNKRTWQHVLAQYIRVGDTVPDLGVVQWISHYTDTVTLKQMVMLSGPERSLGVTADTELLVFHGTDA